MKNLHEISMQPTQHCKNVLFNGLAIKPKRTRLSLKKFKIKIAQEVRQSCAADLHSLQCNVHTCTYDNVQTSNIQQCFSHMTLAHFQLAFEDKGHKIGPIY